MNESQENKTDKAKRKFLKKALYIAPIIITMKAIPSFASSGSGAKRRQTSQNIRPQSIKRQHRRSKWKKHKR